MAAAVCMCGERGTHQTPHPPTPAGPPPTSLMDTEEGLGAVMCVRVHVCVYDPPLREGEGLGVPPMCLSVSVCLGFIYFLI